MASYFDQHMDSYFDQAAPSALSRIIIKIKTKNFTNSPTWKLQKKKIRKKVEDAVAHLLVFTSCFLYLNVLHIPLYILE